ncbi:MAG: hypothetical protein JW994_04015, partial [Candidatus Omnitrophica bacterium]|nr:hypothetical protein [Candidatus Omnitrophota bacterium]
MLKRKYKKLIAIVLSVSFFTFDIAWANPDACKNTLAVWLGSERTAVRRRMLGLAMERYGWVVSATSEEAEEFLRTHNAAAMFIGDSQDKAKIKAAQNKDAVILISDNFTPHKSDKILTADSGNFKNDLALIRHLTNVEIKLIMQIMKEKAYDRYSDIREKVLTSGDIMGKYRALYAPGKAPDLPPDLLFDEIMAKAFEMMVLLDRRGKYALRSEFTNKERAFIDAIAPVINWNKTTFFTGAFWDPNVRFDEIRIALANGKRFYPTFSRKTSFEADNDNYEGMSFAQEEALAKVKDGLKSALTLNKLLYSLWTKYYSTRMDFPLPEEEIEPFQAERMEADYLPPEEVSKKLAEFDARIEELRKEKEENERRKAKQTPQRRYDELFLDFEDDILNRLGWETYAVTLKDAIVCGKIREKQDINARLDLLFDRAFHWGVRWDSCTKVLIAALQYGLIKDKEDLFVYLDNYIRSGYRDELEGILREAMKNGVVTEASDLEKATKSIIELERVYPYRAIMREAIRLDIIKETSDMEPF